MKINGCNDGSLQDARAHFSSVPSRAIPGRETVDEEEMK